MKLPNPWRGLAGLPREVWALSAATLVNRMGTMALPFLALYLTRGLGHPPKAAALALGAYGVGSLIGTSYGGRLCDRIGAWRVMMGSLLLSGILLAALPLVERLELVLAVVFVWSVVGEGVRPASLSLVTALVRPDQRKQAFTLNWLAVNLGMSVGPVVGGFLAAVSFPALFWLDGASSILAVLLLALLLRRAAAAKAAAGDPVAALPPPTSTARGPGVLRDPVYLTFLAGVSLGALVFFQGVGPLPLFVVEELGQRESTYGLLMAINTVMIVLVEAPLSAATAHWPHRTGLVLGSLLFAVGFGGLGLANGALGVAAMVVIWTVGEMILFPAMGAYAADAAPEARRGEYMGAYTTAFGLAFTVGPAAGTLVQQRIGSDWLWAITAVVGVVSATVLARAAHAWTVRPQAAQAKAA